MEVGARQATEFHNLKHGAYYNLILEPANESEIAQTAALIKSVAYPDAELTFKTGQERNMQTRNHVEAVFRSYMHISHPEDFLYYHGVIALAH